MNETEKLRALPSVHEVLERLSGSLTRFPRALIVAETRRALDDARAEILSGRTRELTPETRICQALEALERPALRRVINATGVVLHTNLGRAPLPAMEMLRGYSNLEYDLERGRRGKRDTHAAPLIERLIGAPGIAVNNNAAAVFLALHELASGGEVVVSRGELIEIGDGFRIPDIMSRSGATVREVGTTNRTRIEDYRDAINQHTRLLFRVHPSNFRITGFTARPELRELAALGRERSLARPRAESAGLRGPGKRLRGGPLAFRNRRAAGVRQPPGRRRPGLLQRRQTPGWPPGRYPGGQAGTCGAPAPQSPVSRAAAR
ncbi:hypothetical protein SBA3_40015 [Candidatus Sulfopaludibacter sp. SbA3]|nr:hypothetical protein SBA3_40015 [Candidatus Sulfopaludibacter sp. SbA3]